MTTADQNVDNILAMMDIGAGQLMLDIGESPEALRGALVVVGAVISLAEHFRSANQGQEELVKHASTNVATLALMGALAQRIQDVTP